MSLSVWTTPEGIRDRLRKLWDSGRLLSALLSHDALFPIEWRLVRPKSHELGEFFGEVRKWIHTLEGESREKTGFGYEIRWEEIDHRTLGRNRLPVRVVIPSPEEAFRMIGKRRDAESFLKLAERTTRDFPGLSDWLVRYPMTLLSQGEEWERVLSVLSWFVQHPRPGLYLRQLDIAGVDTKFIESRRGILMDLLDRILPSEGVDLRFSGVRGFEARYGLLSKPVSIRFRILDSDLHLGGFSDLSVPVEEFAHLSLPVERVFITENEINGLAFPEIRKSLVIFGLGYALDQLDRIGWLADRDLFYWGDIDTHGFAILDRLREIFPGVRSFLMDRETLFCHRQLWVQEGDPHNGVLSHLADDERDLYADLKENRFGKGVRLEQERIPFHRVMGALSDLKVL
ncbi:MAG: DUF3322 domain-containing protein [Leptospirales bacterium]